MGSILIPRVPFVGTSAPANPIDGQLWWDTDDNGGRLKVWNATGGTWDYTSGPAADLAMVLAAGNDGGGAEIANLADPTTDQSADTKAARDAAIAASALTPDAGNNGKWLETSGGVFVWSVPTASDVGADVAGAAAAAQSAAEAASLPVASTLHGIAAANANDGNVDFNSHALTNLLISGSPSDGDPVGYDSSSGGLKKIAASGAAADGWTDDSAETWTYVSATSFKVSGVDLTAKYSPGTRIKLTQSSTVKYFVVSSSSFSTDTTVNITGGSDYTLANSTISANNHSYQANPQGYPGTFNFTSGATGFSSLSTNSAHFSVVGSLCSVYYRLQGTSNDTRKYVNLPIPSALYSDYLPQANGGYNNNSGPTALGNAYAASATVVHFRYGTESDASWTGSGTATITQQLTYEI